MKSLQEDIKNQDFKQVYLLYGEESYLKQQYKEKLKKDIQRLIKRTSLDINLLGILPENWEEMYDQITEF